MLATRITMPITPTPNSEKYYKPAKKSRVRVSLQSLDVSLELGRVRMKYLYGYAQNLR